MAEAKTTLTDVSSGLSYYSKTPIIETVGLSKVYKVGKEMVNPVSDISLQIGYGDFVVIFGPSGAGKSTLLNILMGVEPPDFGQVLLKGESLFDYSDEERTVIRLKRFGLIPAAQFWLDHVSLLDNVALPLLLQGQHIGEARAKARSMLELVGSTAQGKHRPHDLSSGQQQKATIARALINDPWIVFADEPTAHLDSQATQAVVDLLVKINRERQVTVVMVTHDLQFLQYAKKWFLVRDGRLWDIKDRKSPFHDIQEALGYVEKQEGRHVGESGVGGA